MVRILPRGAKILTQWPAVPFGARAGVETGWDVGFRISPSVCWAVSPLVPSFYRLLANMKIRVTGGGPSPHVCYIKSTRNSGSVPYPKLRDARFWTRQTAVLATSSDVDLAYRNHRVTRRRYTRLLRQARGTCRDPYSPNMQLGQFGPAGAVV